eukprot:4167074-Pyramimonas_sp.AAC.1
MPTSGNLEVRLLLLVQKNIRQRFRARSLQNVCVANSRDERRRCADNASNTPAVQSIKARPVCFQQPN